MLVGIIVQLLLGMCLAGHTFFVRHIILLSPQNLWLEIAYDGRLPRTIFKPIKQINANSILCGRSQICLMNTISKFKHTYYSTSNYKLQ
jgi:hypothetical protein